MPSVFAALRCAPQQERSAQRLSIFVQTAAELFARTGFEAATMTEIAASAGTSIGSLYHYFPDKEALASAVLNQYARDIQEHWRPLIDSISTLSPEEFADSFIERTMEFFQQRPAYFRLFEAPFRFSRDPAVRKAIRMAFASAFQSRNPLLDKERALLAADVSLQMVRGMMNVYAEADPKHRAMIGREFKNILALYLAHLLSHDRRHRLSTHFFRSASR
jgi:AcrR family transcriptional regulator